jgi:hypothetical protein
MRSCLVERIARDAARDAARRAEAAAEFGGRPLLLDVTDADTIAAAAATVAKLDVPVNNQATPRWAPPDPVRRFRLLDAEASFGVKRDFAGPFGYNERLQANCAQLMQPF